jgi:hypothetical protein
VRAFIAIVAAAAAAACGGQSLLARVQLNESDLPGSVRLQTVPLVDEPTLDLCGAEFPSEALREARIEQVAIDKNGPEIGDRGEFSVESVVYDSAESAAQAFDELRSAIESCPDVFRGAKGQEHHLVSIPDAQLGKIAPDHVAVYTTAQDSQDRWGNPLGTRAIVYQRRGRVMIGLYGPDLATIGPYIPVVASRLASLTPSEAGE